LRIAGNPKRARGCRAGAADLIGFLAQQNIKPFERRHQRRCHASRASAGDNQIDFAIEHRH
jgi:hypothetical protein